MEQACVGTHSRESDREVERSGLLRCGDGMILFLMACSVGRPFPVQNTMASLRQFAVHVPCEPDSVNHHGALWPPSSPQNPARRLEHERCSRNIRGMERWLVGNSVSPGQTTTVCKNSFPGLTRGRVSFSPSNRLSSLSVTQLPRQTMKTQASPVFCPEARQGPSSLPWGHVFWGLCLIVSLKSTSTPLTVKVHFFKAFLFGGL